MKDLPVVGMPSSTAIDLPPITVKGEYIVNTTNSARMAYGLEGYRELEPEIASTFLRAVVDVGHLEQSLTTDLLNQLIFLQKGFIKVVVCFSCIHVCAVVI